MVVPSGLKKDGYNLIDEMGPSCKDSKWKWEMYEEFIELFLCFSPTDYLF